MEVRSSKLKKKRVNDHLITIMFVSSIWSVIIVIKSIYTEIKSSNSLNVAEVYEAGFTGLALIRQLFFHVYEHPGRNHYSFKI